MGELLAGMLGRIVVELLFYGLFYLIGWVVIRIVTLGRHPGPWRGWEGAVDITWVAFVGLLTTVAAVIVVVKYILP